ncbi:MAG: sigma-54-dependent Fis family transcriptional regulator [Calditrichaeota bacterium]|nr:sigma-54-dependent Fis family transcriptional regulator [Calditrichota bacterium]
MTSPQTKSALSPAQPILILDDEVHSLQAFELALNLDGLNNVIPCHDSREATRIIATQELSAVVIDLIMPHRSGEEILMYVSHEQPGIPAIIITGVNEIETAVRCIKAGAYDYLLKPVDDTRLLTTLRRALEYYELQAENVRLRESFGDRAGIKNPEAFDGIITRHKGMLSQLRYIEAIGVSSQPVLITGETGVGKELCAQAIHRISGRKGEFVALNVAGVDSHFFTDTLFGHVRGAYTGADRNRDGLVAKAAGGTLFLDEIGDLAMDSQVKLLRLIQDHEYFPLGSDVPRRADVRIVVATNRDARELMESGRFRRDFYYRLNAHHVHLPPLRDRREDLPLLLDHYLEQASHEMKRRRPTPPDELLVLLRGYAFPGNIRELRAMIYDAVASHTAKKLSMQSFERHIQWQRRANPHPIAEEAGDGLPFDQWPDLPPLREMIRMTVAEAVRRAEGNQSIAAEMLDISRATVAKYVAGKVKIE